MDSLSGVSVNTVSGNPLDVCTNASNTTLNPVLQYDSFEHGGNNQGFGRYMPQTLHGEPADSVNTDTHFTNQAGVTNSDTLITSFARDVMRYGTPGSLGPFSNTSIEEHFMSGTPISSVAVTPLYTTRNGLQEDLNSLAISGRSTYPSEVLRTCDSSDCSNSFVSSVNQGCFDMFSNMNGKGNFCRFSETVELGGKFPSRPAFHSLGSMVSNNWLLSNGSGVINTPYSSCTLSNELSLSLATSQPSNICGTSIVDQCSEVSCVDVACHCLKGKRLGSEQESSKRNSCGSCRSSQRFQIIPGSQYLLVVQEILSQIASYSLANINQMSLSTSGSITGTSIPILADCPIDERTRFIGLEASPNVDRRFDVEADPGLQKGARDKKAQLLTLLKLVDDQYSQCLDEIHTVISAFHAATELDPQIHTRFALQTISLLYKNLRGRISSQIRAMGVHLDPGFMGQAEGSFDSYFQKQWTLQQLKKKDNQLWRPQRGLPERSVSVLRAWMFQNFLHPYPKDADKHLLALRSGLTRSQVSNWFINARVRLWKPMIEEMYAEMNRRKAQQSGTGNCLRGEINLSNSRFNVN
ncbi:hypothetical protein K2173_015816 [Erythroxylum novogranatense]|uniref:Homeobox domain-containing protein n=1 Tax=Erythroxylum novogranatense TaxID=1862640 RepID=A0AAV8SF21_9ROSI|nr:hypothetical protein K2173_015816 [Erythroxylum novogranatense]